MLQQSHTGSDKMEVEKKRSVHDGKFPRSWSLLQPN